MWNRVLAKIVVLSLFLLVFAGQVGAAEEERLGEKLAPEGFGAVTKGGAGGRVIWVTTLNPDGPGSFVEAINAEGPRIIKFKVAGEIDISRQKRKANYFIWVGWPHRPHSRKAPGGPLNYDSPHSHITVDGASAPEPGITFTNGGFYIGYGVHDVIIRHIRIKHGVVGGASGSGICTETKRILVDHCTVTEAVDQAFDVCGGGHDVTAQWCIIGVGSKTGHPKGFDHSAGPFIAYGGTRVTLHHNLILKNRMRNPFLYGDYKLDYRNQTPPIADVVNNTIFDCYQGTLVGAGMRANLVGNFYLRQHAPAIYIVTKYPGQPKLYFKDNASFPDLRDHSGNLFRVGKPGKQAEAHKWIVKEPFSAPAVRTQPPLEAAKLVLAQCGARPWARGPIEAPLIAEARAAAAKLLEQPSKSAQP